MQTISRRICLSVFFVSLIACTSKFYPADFLSVILGKCTAWDLTVLVCRDKCSAMALFDVVLQELLVQTTLDYENVIDKCRSFGYKCLPSL